MPVFNSYNDNRESVKDPRGLGDDALLTLGKAPDQVE